MKNSIFARMQRGASAAGKAHQLGDMIDHAVSAQETYDALPMERRVGEADKVSLELDRLLQGLRKVSPVALRRSAHKLIKMIRHLHTGLRRYFESDHYGQLEEADAMAHHTDRLVCVLAGLDPDDVSVTDFEI